MFEHELNLQFWRIEENSFIALPLPFYKGFLFALVAIIASFLTWESLFAQTEATSLLTHSVAPDSVDYALWAREAFFHGLRGFSVRGVNMSESDGRTDTLSSHTVEYKLARQSASIILSANTTSGESWYPLVGDGDSVAIEFDSAGQELSESRFSGNTPISLQRWKYDDAGRMLRSWYEFSSDSWHPTEDFIYGSDGMIERVELRGHDGSVVGSHTFHKRDPDDRDAAREIVEYDTAYKHGMGLLTSVQLTTFDSSGRVERYQYRSVGVGGAFRTPFGFLNVYHDSAHSYRMEQYPLSVGPKAPGRYFYDDVPSRWVSYDSVGLEEDRTTLDSTGQKVVAANRYLSDERYLASSLSTISHPIEGISCNYNHQGLLDSVIVRDLLHGWTRALQFNYIYTSTGP